MDITDDLADLSEVVRDQVAQGVARDLAIKLLAGLVSQMIDDDQYQETIGGHLRAIRGLEADGDTDTEMNERIAAHFHDLLVAPPEGDAN